MKIFTLTIFIVSLSLLSLGQNPAFNWEKTELSDNVLKWMTINGNDAIIAGYDNGFFKSTNGGTSWDTLNLIQPKFNFFDLSIKGNIGYSVARASNLYNAKHAVSLDGLLLKTIDSGKTWNVIDSPVFEPANDPTLSPNDTLCYAIDYQSIETINDTIAFCGLRWFVYTNTGYVIHAGIFKTKDGGATWTNISGDMGSNLTSCITFLGENGFAGGNKHLLKLSASADTVADFFENMDSNGKGFIYDISMVNENKLYLITTSDSVYYSVDGGNSFIKFPEIKGGLDIFNVNDTTIVISGSTGKSYVSTDSGQSWKNLNISTSIWEIAGILKDSLNLLANSSIYKIAIDDLLAGNYNYSIETIGNGNLQKAYIAGEDTMIVVGFDAGFFKTVDGGTSWSSVEIPHVPALDRFAPNVDFDGLSMVGDKGYASFNRIRFVDYPAGGPDDIYWSGGILFTEDNWETSSFLDITKLGKESPDDVSLNPNHANCTSVNTGLLKYVDNDVLLLYCKWYDYTSEKTEHGRIFKTLDSGKNWIAITEDLTNHYVNDLEISGDTMYIAGSKLLLKTTNADLLTGTSIIDFANLYPILYEGENNVSVNSVWFDNNEIYTITTSDSCYFSTDGGASFSTFCDIKGSNDFYRFDTNSSIILGGNGKSKFTNNMTDWTDCYPGSTIFKIGGVYNGKIYGLGKGDVYSTSVESLDIKTSAPLTLMREGLNVYYGANSVQVVSDNKNIERCTLYSITGKTVSVQEPNSRICRFNTGNYQPGIYILNSVIGGKTFSNKVVF